MSHTNSLPVQSFAPVPFGLRPMTRPWAGLLVTLASFCMVTGASAWQDNGESRNAETHGKNLPGLNESESSHEQETLQLMDVKGSEGGEDEFDQGEFLSTVLSAAQDMQRLIAKAEQAEAAEHGPAKAEAIIAVMDELMSLLEKLSRLDEDLQEYEIYKKYMAVYRRVQEARAVRNEIEQKVHEIKSIVYDLTPAQIADELKKTAQLYVLSELFKALEEEFGITSKDVAAIKEFWGYLEEPALFADAFLQYELRQWLKGAQTSYDLDDNETLNVRVELAPSTSIRLFSDNKADVGLRFILTYVASPQTNFGGMEVVGEGLTFRYRPGGKYSLEFDPTIDLAESSKRSVIRNVEHFADQFLAQLGVPISIEVTRFPWQNPEKRPYLECKITLDLTKLGGNDESSAGGLSEAAGSAAGEGSDNDSIPVVLAAENVRIYADRIDWRDTIFRGSYQEFVEVYSGFGFHEMGGYAKPAEQEFGPTCKIGHAALLPELVHIRICASTRIPQQFDVINHCGGLYVLNQKLSHFVGHTDFRTGRAWGKYFRGKHLEFEEIRNDDGEVVEYVLGPRDSKVRLSVEAGKYFFDQECCGTVMDVSKLGYKDGEFLYEDSVLTMTGTVEVFEKTITDFRTEIDFSTGQGPLRALKRLMVMGQDFGPTFAGHFDVRRNRFEFSSTATVELPDHYFHDHRDVVVTLIGQGPIDPLRSGAIEPSLTVHWSQLGVSGRFSVPSLPRLTVQRLLKEVQSKLPQTVSQQRLAIEKWRREKPELVAQWARYWRAVVAQQAGNHWSFDGSMPEIEEFLDDLVSQHERDKKEILDKATKPLEQVLGGLFAGEENGDQPSEEEVRQQARQREFEKQMSGFVAALNGARFTRNEGPNYDDLADVSDLTREFRSFVGTAAFATAVASGEEKGVVGLLIPVSEFCVQLDDLYDKTIHSIDSQVIGATISFEKLVPGSRGRGATARIEIQDCVEVSGLETQRRVRYQLQELVELYFPEVQVLGLKKLVERRLILANPHDFTVFAWVQHESRSVRDRRFRWDWSPDQPGTNEALQFRIPARSKREVAIPLETNSVSQTARDARGRRARVWFELADGRQISEYRAEDLWLVRENNFFDGERAYEDVEMQSFEFSVPDPPSPGVFSERNVLFRNETEESLEIDLEYLSSMAGVKRWRSLDGMQLLPGESKAARLPEGQHIRASQIRFVARGDNILYDSNRNEPMHLVGESNGRRLYRANRIGYFVYVFKPIQVEQP